MFTFPTQFRGLSEGLHQTEEVFHESWPGTGTGKGDMDAGRGKRSREKDRVVGKYGVRLQAGGSSDHDISCQQGLYPLGTGEPQQIFFFFLSRAQFTDIQIHSFSVYTRAGFAK